MRLFFRAFSSLSVKSLTPSSLLSFCETLNPDNTSHFEDYPFLISELIKYNRTNEIISKLITSHFNSTKSPVKLPESSYNDLLIYLNQSLISRDMLALDSSVHLLWNNFQDRKFPLTQIVNTLVSTKPLGTEENKRIWRKIVSELVFYAIPSKLSPETARKFLDFYGVYPENFINLVKYGYFYRDVSYSDELLEKMNEFNDDDGLGPDFNTKKYIKGLFLSKEEEELFFNIQKEMINQVRSNNNEIDENLLKKAEKFIEDYRLKRMSGNSNYKNNLIPDSKDQLNIISKKEHLLDKVVEMMENENNLKKTLRLSEYSDRNLLLDKFMISEPELDDFLKLEEWFESLVNSKNSLDLDYEIMGFIVVSAIRLKRDDFICFLLYNYNSFSKGCTHEMIFVRLIEIIAKSNCSGKRVEAAARILNEYDSQYKESDTLGLFSKADTVDFFAQCYIRDNRFSDALTFVCHINTHEICPGNDVLEPIIEHYFQKKDIAALRKIYELDIDNDMYLLSGKYIYELKENKIEDFGSDEMAEARDPYISKYEGFRKISNQLRNKNDELSKEESMVNSKESLYEEVKQGEI